MWRRTTRLNACFPPPWDISLTLILPVTYFLYLKREDSIVVASTYIDISGFLFETLIVPLITLWTNWAHAKLDIVTMVGAAAEATVVIVFFK